MYGKMCRCPECGTVCEESYWGFSQDGESEVCPICDWEGISIPMIAREENGQVVYREE
jgi:hypothetical protein